MRLLILGGTHEATKLIAALGGIGTIAPTLSLAGRTEHPVLPDIPVRIGGFGGIDGLKTYLQQENIAAVIDATHPFAAQMTRNAAIACHETSIPRLILTRKPWQRQSGDRWMTAENVSALPALLGDKPRRVFLTLGRLHLAVFLQAPQHHYIIRSIDPPQITLPQQTLILARPPFSLINEIELMQAQGIDVLVTKNSGGTMTSAKIEAARTLNIPVVLWQPPALPEGDVAYDVQSAIQWLKSHLPPP